MDETPRKARRRRAGVAAAVLAILLASCGDDGGDAQDAAGGERPGFCADLERVVTAGVELNEALFDGDEAELRTAVDEYPGLAAAAEESAPPEIVDDVGTLREETGRLLDRIEGVDLSDRQALEAAVADAGFAPELEEAGSRISEYAEAECGFDPATTAADALGA